MSHTPHAEPMAPALPWREEDKELVRTQLERLLDTHYFRNSRRYPSLFRFLVEETLAGRGELLKERLIGIHVFDRSADYDTAADPIVRVTIAEIRKRIAQYYHEDAHETELRIEMTPGRYEPEFRLRRDPGEPDRLRTAEAPARSFEAQTPKPLSLSSEAAQVQDQVQEPGGEPRHAVSRWKLAALAAAILLGLFLVLAFWSSKKPTAIDDFWSPVLASRSPVTFCLPVPGRSSDVQSSMLGAVTPSPSMEPAPPASNPSFLAHETLGENLVFSDVQATLALTNLLAAGGHASRIRMSAATTLDDLRQGPVVLIGGLDNPWTLRGLEHLRFHFVDDGREHFHIGDERNPTNRDWSLDLTTPYAAVTHDFALVARRHNSVTGQVEVIVAGIGMSGTAAAGEFLSSQSQMKALQSVVGKGFATRDFEAVLGTDVVDGRTGPPRILAVDVQ